MDKAKHIFTTIANMTEEEVRAPPKSNNPVIMERFNPRFYSKMVLEEHNLIYDPKDRFWRYDKESGLWREDADKWLNSFLRTEVLGTEALKKHYVREIISDLKGLCYTRELPEEPGWNFIPFRNGVYDLFTDEFKDFSPSQFFIQKLDTDYDPEITECPEINRIFGELVREEDTITLYELAAYCLVRAYPYQKAFFLYGGGSNGKTVYTNILSRFVGEPNVSAVDLEEFVGYKNKFAPGYLYNKLINIAGEVDYNDIKKPALFKKLTGDDFIICDRKNKEPFLFKNHAKLIYNVNILPETRDKTDSFYRRVFLIDFPNKFVEGENAEALLVEKLPSSEFSGLAYKAIQVLKELYKRDFVFTRTSKIDELRERYEELSSPLDRFIKDYCDTSDPDAYTAKREFRDRFNQFLDDQGVRKWNDTELGIKMKGKFEDKKRTFNKERWDAWIGIRLK